MRFYTIDVYSLLLCVVNVNAIFLQINMVHFD